MIRNFQFQHSEHMGQHVIQRNAFFFFGCQNHENDEVPAKFLYYAIEVYNKLISP